MFNYSGDEDFMCPFFFPWIFLWDGGRDCLLELATMLVFPFLTLSCQ